MAVSVRTTSRGDGVPEELVEDGSDRRLLTGALEGLLTCPWICSPMTMASDWR